MRTNELKQLAQSLRWDSGWNSHWKGCTEVGLKLFETLPIKFSISIAYQYLEEYRIVFQQYHPDTKWVYNRLNAISDFMKSESEKSLGVFLLPDEQSEFATPGSNGFIKQLEAFWEMFASTSSTRTKENTFYIITGIIMCKLDERWGAEESKAWQQWYTHTHNHQNEAGDNQRLKFVNSSSIGRQAGLEWMMLANRIEAISEKE